MPPKKKKGDHNTQGVIFTNADQESTYKRLAERAFKSTRYLDRRTLSELGIEEDFNRMATEIGMLKFSNIREPSYKQLTLEFLSSLEVSINKDSDNGKLSFRMGNRDYNLTLRELNGIFGFCSSGLKILNRPSLFIVFCPKTFWKKLSGEDKYTARIASASSIVNPCFRVMQRFLANTIFSRGDSQGRVRKGELFFLWAMVCKKRVNIGYFLAEHLNYIKKRPSGAIQINGLITSIARYVGYDFSGLEELEGKYLLDLAHFKSCGLIGMTINKQIFLKFSRDAKKRWPLPDKAHTTIIREENWYDMLMNSDSPGVEGDEEDGDGEEGEDGDEDEDVDGDEDDEDMPQAPSSSSTRLTPPASDPTLSAILAELKRIGDRVDNIDKRTRLMYDWHVSQAGPPSTAYQ